MKQVWLVLLCLNAGGVSVKAQHDGTTTSHWEGEKAPAYVLPVPDTLPDPHAGKFKFKKETYDLGEVPDSVDAECDFEFKNVGKKPIVITEAHGSCGCAVPSWPKGPIKPKHRGVIHVVYNTRGRVGMIDKDVVVTSNAVQHEVRLHITGTVLPPEEDVKPPPIPVPPPLPPQAIK